MKVLHGFWLPENGSDFIQSGRFYLWVETDEVTGRKPSNHHPRQLADNALAELLENDLGMKSGASPTPLSSALTIQEIKLPTRDARPLPSPELGNPFEQEFEAAAITLEPWQVACYPLDEPIKNINDIHFLCCYQTTGVRIGSDFLFWYFFSQSLKPILYKDQYIPALLQQKGKKRLFRSWQILSPGYQALLQQAVLQMPLACSLKYDRESLLRHFSEVVIGDILDSAAAAMPQSFRKKLDDSLLESMFSPERVLNKKQFPVERLSQWQRWRQKLAGSQQQGRFQLCLQLHAADAAQPDNWHIRFLAGSLRDPSFRLELSAYWRMGAADRQALYPLLGDDFEPSLLYSLGQAARIYPKLWHGMETSTPESVNLNLDEAFEFLKEQAWILEDAGFRVIVPAWWTPQGRQRAKIRLRTKGAVSSDSSKSPKALLSLEQLIDYDYQLSIGDQPVSAAEWQQLVEAKTPLVMFRGQWMELDPDKMEQMLAFWQQQSSEPRQISIPELIKTLAEKQQTFELDQQDSLAQMLAGLTDTSQLEPVDDLQQLHASLRDYQKRGVAWLRYLEQLGLNGCLADDMGLGKTIQVIARLVQEREADTANPPTLLIAPTSVMGNWQKEIERFAPRLNTHIHHGSNRHTQAQTFTEQALSQDMVITSYTLARKDIKLLSQVKWKRIVLDEAQNIKNPKAAQTKAILKLDAEHRLALTGTPVENRLMDLWSIFNFLNPGYLGNQAQFRKHYELPIQRSNDPQQSIVLKKLIEPFILRRLKTDRHIIKDLPDKIESRLYCNLSKEQASLYQAVVEDVSEQLEQQEGIARQGLMLSTLMKLKQICNHPGQFLQDDSDFSTQRSHKLERLSEMLEEALSEGDSVLIFTQFTEIGEKLHHYLAREQGVNCYYLHGGTSRDKREAMISEFQDPDNGPSVFVLSLKAGGVGITLTKANHVFHFDRWWNPAVEDQASDRAFRIGQKKTVFVHKFITLGTLEERIDQMIEDKKTLAQSIVGSDESWLTTLDNEAFKALIALNSQTVME